MRLIWPKVLLPRPFHHVGSPLSRTPCEADERHSGANSRRTSATAVDHILELPTRIRHAEFGNVPPPPAGPDVPNLGPSPASNSSPQIHRMRDREDIRETEWRRQGIPQVGCSVTSQAISGIGAHGQETPGPVPGWHGTPANNGPA